MYGEADEQTRFVIIPSKNPKLIWKELKRKEKRLKKAIPPPSIILEPSITSGVENIKPSSKSEEKKIKSNQTPLVNSLTQETRLAQSQKLQLSSKSNCLVCLVNAAE